MEKCLLGLSLSGLILLQSNPWGALIDYRWSLGAHKSARGKDTHLVDNLVEEWWSQDSGVLFLVYVFPGSHGEGLPAHLVMDFVGHSQCERLRVVQQSHLFAPSMRECGDLPSGWVQSPEVN